MNCTFNLDWGHYLRLNDLFETKMSSGSKLSLTGHFSLLLLAFLKMYKDEMSPFLTRRNKICLLVSLCPMRTMTTSLYSASFMWLCSDLYTTKDEVRLNMFKMCCGIPFLVLFHVIKVSKKGRTMKIVAVFLQNMAPGI